MAVWGIPSLHLCTSEARYLVGHMTHHVVWEQMYSMLLKLTSPESRAFMACNGDNTAIHGAACYLPDRLQHLYKPPPHHHHHQMSCSLVTGVCSGYPLPWMVG